MIFGRFRGHALPCVFVLMTRKTRDMYIRVLQCLQTFANSNGIQLNPQVIISDFEAAAISAFRDVFPGSSSHGCFFHLCQSVNRKVCEFGFKVRYQEDAAFALLVRQLPALAFLPQDEIAAAFALISAELTAVGADRIANYFFDTYVRVNSRFPIALWCCQARNEAGDPRSNCASEAWNRRWGSLLSKRHASIVKFVTEILREEKTTVQDYERLNAGQEIARPTARAERERQARVRQLIADRETMQTRAFLRAVAHNFMF